MHSWGVSRWMCSHKLFGPLSLTALPFALEELYLVRNSFSGNLDLSSLPIALRVLSGSFNSWNDTADLSAAPASLLPVDLSYCMFTRFVLSPRILFGAEGMSMDLSGNPYVCPLPPVPAWVKVTSTCRKIDSLTLAGQQLRYFVSGVGGCQLVNISWHLGYPCLQSWRGLTCGPGPGSVGTVPRELSLSADACGSYASAASPLNFIALSAVLLVSLSLRSELFGGTVPLGQLPASLQELTLQGCRFTGTVDLSHAPGGLRRLSMAANAFTGTPNLTALPFAAVAVNLSGNHFIGTVLLSGLPPNLTVVSLSGNQLSELVVGN
eukprot:RCo015724